MIAPTEEPSKEHGSDIALDEGYRAMAADVEREKEAPEWVNALARDSTDRAR